VPDHDCDLDVRALGASQEVALCGAPYVVSRTRPFLATKSFPKYAEFQPCFLAADDPLRVSGLIWLDETMSEKKPAAHVLIVGVGAYKSPKFKKPLTSTTISAGARSRTGSSTRPRPVSKNPRRATGQP